MASIFDIQAATLAARKRTGDDTIGTRVSKGQIQVVRVVYPEKGGYAKVTPLNDYSSDADAIAFLNAL